MIAVAMGVMNLTTYGFVIVAARLLGPAEYGALAAVMGLLLVVNVLSLGLQATGARRVSSAPGDRARIEHEVMAAGYRSSLALGALMLLATPAVTAVLNLDQWGAAALIGVTAVPLTVMGGQAGILQGERRWGPLAAIYLTVGLGRIGFGVAGLLVEPDTLGAMTGVAAGAFLPVVVGWYALRRPDRPLGAQAARDARAHSPGRSRWAPGGVLRETLHNSHALLAFFALSNADVVIARSTLDEHQAGLYAGGLILSKAVLFLPQFVVVIAFPSMSRRDAGREKHLVSLGAVLAIGAVTVAGVAALSGLAVVFVGGPEYAELAEPAVGVRGPGDAARDAPADDLQHRRPSAAARGAAGVGRAGRARGARRRVPFVGSVPDLLAVVVGVDAVLFVVLLVRSLAPSYGEPARVVASQR